jgi:hypothetical protein
MTEPTAPAPISTEDYVNQTAQMIGLPIPLEYHQSVVENFERIRTVAQLVIDVPLPEHIEIAPVFEP